MRVINVTKHAALPTASKRAQKRAPSDEGAPILASKSLSESYQPADAKEAYSRRLDFQDRTPHRLHSKYVGFQSVLTKEGPGRLS